MLVIKNTANITMHKLHTFYKHLMELNLMGLYLSFIFINIFTTFFN